MAKLRNLKSASCHRPLLFLVVSFTPVFPIGSLLAQQPRVAYIYDDLGRLHRVIDEGGHAATYHYDAVGNILRITRETGVAANATAITVTPTSGVRGTGFPFTITGTNLAGASLTVGVAGFTIANIRTSLDQITADVTLSPAAPIGLTQILVETAFGSIPIPFTILDTAPSILILNPTEGTTTIENAQLTLTAQAADNIQVNQVAWNLNGVAGPITFTPPYEAIVNVPLNISSLDIQATATDSIGQTSVASRTLTVLPDPPPSVVITSPAEGATVIEGTQITLSATATDNVQVTDFVWTVNGIEEFAILSPPYDKVVTVPLGDASLTVIGAATDNLGRTTTATRTVTVVPTPKTTVIGRVVTNLGQPLEGANVSVFVQYGAVSQADGTFSIPDVPTNQGPISANAQIVIGGATRSGVSASLPPVADGTTNVGDIVIASGATADLYPGPKIGIDAAPSLVLADLNGDGIVDIAAPNINTNDLWVFLGTGAGTFQTEQRFPVGNSPWAIASADLNGDGLPDLIATNTSADDVSLLLGNGNGTFQAQQRHTVGDYPYAVAIVDFNNDGFRDLVVANQGSNDISVLLGNGNGTFQAQQRYDVGLTPQWVAVADLNRDGSPDIVTANTYSNNVSVLINNGDGTFQSQLTFATGFSPVSVGIADLNGDGFQDLAVANNFGDNGVSILLGNGNGTFQPEQRYFAGGDSMALTIADVSGDGIRDLIVAHQFSPFLSVLLGSGDGTFQNQQTVPLGGTFFGPQYVAVADVNQDGRQDLVSSLPFTGEILISFGNGDGTFQPQVTPPTYATGASPRSVTSGDLDGDGIPDIIVGNRSSNDVSVLLANGDGTLRAEQRFPVGTNPLAVATADLNGDGFSDIVSANNSTNNISVLLGNGDGTFQPQQTFGAGAGARAVAIGDVNGDGIRDLVVGNGLSIDVSVLLGIGDGTFQPEQRFALGSGPNAIALADLNGDSFLDIIAANSGDVSVLFGNGDGTFQSQLTLTPAVFFNSVAGADLNGDGFVDIAATSGGQGWVLLGNGDGTFQPGQIFQAGFGARSVVLADVNGDGKIDILTANSTGSDFSVLLGNGTGNFQPQQRFVAGNGPFAMAVVDLNGDGKPDVVTANRDGNNVSVILHR